MSVCKQGRLQFIGCSAEELVKLSIQDIVSEDMHMTDTLLPDLAAGIIPILQR